jgi:hypothetical protein
MKIKLDIDCTPEEMRAFFGLPDVKPMQEKRNCSPPADAGWAGAPDLKSVTA